jgi:hypothetical protein
MEESIESKEHLKGFFKNTLDYLSQPEFLYGAMMAVSFIAACLLLLAAIVIFVRLIGSKKMNNNEIDVEQLNIPTLEVPDKQQEIELKPVPKEPKYALKQYRPVEEEISEHILNIVQPNRIKRGPIQP